MTPLPITAFGLFGFALLLHWIWWRIRLPRRQLPTLFKALVLFLPIGMAALHAFGYWPLEWILSPASAVVASLYFALTITYVITYSALEGDSPTLSLIRWVAVHPNGVTPAELESFMQCRPFIQARLQALEAEGLIEHRNGRVFIKGTPSLFFHLVLLWRKLYGPLEKGG